MDEYYIDYVVIKGHSFRHNLPLNLKEVVELSREFSSRGYVYHISKKTSDTSLVRVGLDELEKRIREDKKLSQQFL